MTNKTGERKKMDEFEHKLPYHSDEYSTLDECTIREYGFSPLHSLSNVLRKIDRLHFLDHYYLRFRAGFKDTDISIMVDGKPESTRDVPEIDKLRRFVAARTNRKLKDVEPMKYMELYKTYRELTSPKPVQEVPAGKYEQQTLFDMHPHPD